MTQVDFYTGATDRLLIACRLCAKTVQQGLRTIVYASDTALATHFDKLLWTFSPTGFVPHCRDGDKLATVTPVILGNESALVEKNHFNVLLNLDEAVPPDFKHIQRIVEIVDETTSNKQLARKRYRFYQEQGRNVRHHRLDEN